MATYSTNVLKTDNTNYTISVDRLNTDNDNNEHLVETDPALCYQVAFAEYDYSIKRSDKLDNKIYILLTICAFIFAAMTSSIGRIAEVRYPQNCTEFWIVMVYLSLAILSSICVIILLISLIRALSSVNIVRFDSSEVMVRDMAKADIQQVVKYIIPLYVKATEKNDSVIERRYSKLDCSIRLLIVSILLLIVLTLLSSFLPIARDGDNKLSEFYSISDHKDEEAKGIDLDKDIVTEEAIENDEK